MKEVGLIGGQRVKYSSVQQGEMDVLRLIAEEFHSTPEAKSEAKSWREVLTDE